MEKQLINPWQWQNNLGYAQAVEVKNFSKTLYCSGQAAMNAHGQPVAGAMAEQIKLSLTNLEEVIKLAGYKTNGIVRLNIYTISIPDFFAAYGTFAGWLARHGIAPASTLLQVSALAFPELKVEIEATVHA